jgi:hypothetical protein
MWWPTGFDATLGFPGEGPFRDFVSPPGPVPGEAWLRLASSVLNGVSAFAGQPWIADGLSSEAIHDLLLGIALRGNSARPIAARVQSRPDRIAHLLGADSHTAAQAAHGCAYNLGQRPYQIRRPRPILLAAGPIQAAAAEIDRLMHVCGAIKFAPEHDRDKALSETAEAWEQCPLP